MEKPEYACAKCGGHNVRHAMWVALNTNDVQEPFGSWCHGDNSWCADCGEHTRLFSTLDLPVDPTAELVELARELALQLEADKHMDQPELLEVRVLRLVNAFGRKGGR